MNDDDIYILESGMRFGPYGKRSCFQVEKSETCKNIRPSIKMAEFLFLESKGKPVIFIVEAKSSSPRSDSSNSLRLNDFIRDIGEKFSNTLALYVATYLKRHPLTCHELPEAFKLIDLERTDFKLMLIIKSHKKEWCLSLQEALRKELSSVVKTWDLGPNSVLVLNDEMARSKRLIS